MKFMGRNLNGEALYMDENGNCVTDPNDVKELPPFIKACAEVINS